MVELGAVCGRFQIFHREHLQYVLAARERCRHLIVGITSPDSSVALPEREDANRSQARANPCSYYERLEMIQAALVEAGVSRETFDIVPFPIGAPQLLHFYVPKDAYVFLTILDDWGRRKAQRLQAFGYRTEVLWEKTHKGVSSSMLRQYITEGKDWSGFVPPATYRYITQKGIDRRIREGRSPMEE